MLLVIVALISTLAMIGAALAMLLLRNYLAATAAASVMSLALSLLFMLLRAPDVALTEAVVGAGLSGVILALALRKVGLWRIETDAENREVNRELP